MREWGLVVLALVVAFAAVRWGWPAIGVATILAVAFVAWRWRIWIEVDNDADQLSLSWLKDQLRRKERS